jgi:hypothetical protein
VRIERGEEMAEPRFIPLAAYRALVGIRQPNRGSGHRSPRGMVSEADLPQRRPVSYRYVVLNRPKSFGFRLAYPGFPARGQRPTLCLQNSPLFPPQGAV